MGSSECGWLPSPGSFTGTMFSGSPLTFPTLILGLLKVELLGALSFLQSSLPPFPHSLWGIAHTPWRQWAMWCSTLQVSLCLQPFSFSWKNSAYCLCCPSAPFHSYRDYWGLSSVISHLITTRTSHVVLPVSTFALFNPISESDIFGSQM